MATKAAVIASVGAYIPKNRVDNQELSRTLDTSDDWIRSHTGIGSRHIASEQETTSYMATQAALQAIGKAGIQPGEIDQIILATISGDYRGFPATANLVQHALELSGVPSFDIQAACTGFVYGLELGSSLIHSGSAGTVLLIGAEKLSAIVNWKDRSTAVLFGDGAGAAILRGDESADRGLKDSVLCSDGSGWDSLKIPLGGSATPYVHGQSREEDRFLSMDGRKVYEFAVRVNIEIVEQLMERNNLTIDDIDYIVPHQANYRIILSAAKRAGIPLKKYYLNMEEYANTSSASIPLALAEMDDKGLLKQGMKILTVGFGGGLTYGGNFILW